MAVTPSRVYVARKHAILLALFLACFPMLVRGAVLVVSEQESSPLPRITVIFDGLPVKGAKIEIYRYSFGPGEEAIPRCTLKTNKRGEAWSRSLPPGNYHVVASAGQDLRADLYLKVSTPEAVEHSQFSMEMARSQNPTFEQELAAVEQSNLATAINRFQGVISDQSSARIPDVSVKVVRAGTRGKRNIARLHSDNLGRFSAQIPHGDYVVIFESRGFRTRIVKLTIASGGKKKELEITLKLGASST